MIDSSVPGSEGWWLGHLLMGLAGRQQRLNRLDRYYRGDCDLPEGATSARASYRAFQRKSRTNFAELIVEAVRERMQPVGFRTGAAGDDLGDKEAWRIWQANNLDADSALVHRAELAMSDAYVMVGPVDPDTGAAVITPEDPRSVITVHDPRRRRRSLAALKIFSDPVQGADFAYLHFPGRVIVAARPLTAVAAPFSEMSPYGYQYDYQNYPAVTGGGSWEWISDQDTGIDEVPVVRFANRPDMAMNSVGEFEDVLDVLDRINHMLLQRMVIATVQAFRQRAVRNVPMEDADGNPVDYSGIFQSGPDAMWALPDGAEIWESQQVDLSPILQAVRHDVQDLAAVTRTPLFYLTPDAANGSAEGAALAREGLVFKCRDRLAQTGESWEQVMSLAFAMAGDVERAKRADMEIMWAPPEMHSLAERFDAASKAGGAGVPWRTVMSDVLQYSPQEVERMELERAAEPPLPQPPVMPVPQPV